MATTPEMYHEEEHCKFILVVEGCAQSTSPGHDRIRESNENMYEKEEQPSVAPQTPSRRHPSRTSTRQTTRTSRPSPHVVRHSQKPPSDKYYRAKNDGDCPQCGREYKPPKESELQGQRTYIQDFAYLRLDRHLNRVDRERKKSAKTMKDGYFNLNASVDGGCVHHNNFCQSRNFV